MPRRAAVIDVGTNSIKLLVGEKTGSGFRTVGERIKVACLGEGLAKSGSLSAAAMTRGEKVIAAFVATARKRDAGEIAILGTHAIRKADNSEEFAQRIKKKTGVELKELSGEEEALYAFIAATQTVGKNRRVLVFDAGGGSTEFIFGAKRVVLLSRSTPVGALTLFDQCLTENDPPLAKELESARKLAQKIFLQADEVVKEARKEKFALIGVGGIISVLSSVAMKLETLDRAKINGSRLASAAIRAQIDLYCSSTLKERQLIPGMPRDRALIAPAGAVLALAALEFTGKESLVVSANGLRHGAMAQLLKN